MSKPIFFTALLSIFAFSSCEQSNESKEASSSTLEKTEEAKETFKDKKDLLVNDLQNFSKGIKEEWQEVVGTEEPNDLNQDLQQEYLELKTETERLSMEIENTSEEAWYDAEEEYRETRNNLEERWMKLREKMKEDR